MTQSNRARGSRALILVLVAVALGIAAAFLLLQQGPANPREQEASVAAARHDESGEIGRPAFELTQSADSSAVRERAESVAEPVPAAAPSTTTPARPRITGRVLDLDGVPIAGVAIAPRDDPKRTIATSAGAKR